MSTTSLLQTALQNLKVSQQARDPSLTPSTLSVPSSPRRHPRALSQTGSEGTTTPEFSSDEEMISVGKGTRPGTPVGAKGMVLGQRVGKVKDPLRTLPTHLAVRVFLSLDVRSLARCDRVCKRWHKSSTLNYVWFLQNRALTLPLSAIQTAAGKVRKTGSDTPEFFDPYDKTPRLASLPRPPIPSSPVPQWSKAESKRAWKSTFRTTLKRSDPNAEEEIDPLRVDIASLHTSGISTPTGNGHAHAGAGSGGAARWAPAEGEGMTSTERKVAAREQYRALGGRKARGKRGMGGEMGGKDRGGAVEDGRFDAPW
ncbi:uncharacterized protein MKK02DRAFT_24998 [Dioszegia hungarica]|uniref:F-box domain-containing protein n=1 Tax=Dioszegia hungarica TaxID=4972 RepID=A0AA38LVQ1_9TREE|nr:uncharacterized protein MKK02DRAFT_24998 [Dioszegia hungarica]KAI9635834.1 hypothetical protein MKK02DRAFT_24998 [Dioszegia hungarica]